MRRRCSVQLSGRGLSNSGNVTIAPATHDFGSTPIGQQGGTRAFVVTNNGPRDYHYYRHEHHWPERG